MIPGQNPQGAVEISTKSVFASTRKGTFIYFIYLFIYSLFNVDNTVKSTVYKNIANNNC